MRSRTEMVTTTLDGSDFDEDSDFEDSEEDWKPEKGDPKSLKRKTRDIITGTVSGGRRGSGGRSSNGKKRGRKPAAKGRAGRKRKSGNHSDDDDDDDEDDDEDDGDDDQSDSEEGERSTPRARKRGRPSGAKGAKRSNGRKSLAKTSPSTSKAAASTGELALKPIPRKVVNLASSFPDKSGFLKLFAYRGDLEEGIRDNLKVCLWRRDGSSLLQKYFRDKSADATSPQFISSMVYSCWEDKRSDEYMEVKVRCIEQSKQLRVQIYDADTIETKAKEEYEKFIAEHGKPVLMAGGAGSRTSGNGSRSRKKKRAQNNDTEDDEEDTADEEELDEEQEDEEGGGEGAPEEEDDEANADRIEDECEEPPQEE